MRRSGPQNTARLDDSVRQIMCRHLPKLSDSPDQETTLALFEELYKLVAQVSIRQKKIAATLDAAALDAGYHLPVAALRLLQASADSLSDADPRALVFPHRLRSYISSICPLLIRRRMINADDCEEPPFLPQPDMWFQEWLVQFDYTVYRLASDYLADWTPPTPARGKQKRGGIVVAPSVIEWRRKEMDTYRQLRTAEAISQGFIRTRAPLPWSDAQFCAGHRFDPSEFCKWLAGRLPVAADCDTSERIERELKSEIRRMRQAGIEPLISASPLDTP